VAVFEITIQHRTGDTWPIVVRHQPGAGALTRWSRGILDLDLAALDLLPPTDKEYSKLLGQALFRDHVRDAYVAAVAALTPDAYLRVLLIVEAGDLRGRHWHQLCAPIGRRWDPLLLNQRTPFSLYLPAEIERRFPPIGRRDLRALIVVAGPEDLDGDYGLDPFDRPGTVDSIQEALGDIPSQVLASVEGASGPPTLQALLEHLTAGGPSGPHTLLHIVCHGRAASDSSAGQSAAVEPPGLGSTDSILYLPRGEEDGERRPVPATTLVERLGHLDRLPYLTLLSACESASPQAETGLGGAAQRLVRELGLPAVLAMTGRISVDTAGALSAALYERLNAHGQVDLALSQALAGLQGRPDVTVPALFSRLGERALWSDDLARPLTGAEIDHGLDRLGGFLTERAPGLLPEYEAQAGTLQITLTARAEALGAQLRQERQAALDAVNQLCGQALDLSFNALALGGDPPEYDDRCPFRGLYPFRAEDREFFFGRQALVQDLHQRLARHSFLAVLGPSGSGKSSLVLAGLVPVLQKREPHLPLAYLTPGSDPLARLEMALVPAGAEASTGTNSEPEPPPPVVVVDQFEELFTQCDDPAQRQAFVDRLLALLPAQRLVLTMRADFWGDCATLGEFKDQMQAHQELVAPLDAAGLRRAMERQADAVGLRFEAGLGQQILEDVEGEPGAMPLLQHALLLLWNRRHGRWLRWQEYRAFDGIRGAIAHTADQVYKDLSGTEQDRLRDILLRLTRLADAPGGDELRLTRRRVPLAELVPAGDDPAETQALVQRLADERLLVTGVDEATGQREVEVAHEALIQHWPRLRAWLDEDPELARLRQELGVAARAWRDHELDESYLLTGTRLEDLEVLHRQGKLRPTDLEQRYLSACVALRERRRREEVEQAQALAEQERLRAEAERARADDQVLATRRLRRRAIILAVVLGLAVILAVAAGLSGKVAIDNAATATANLALAVTNEEKANSQKETAEANEAEADAQRATSTANLALAVANEAEANAQRATATANLALAVTNEAEAIHQKGTAEANAEIAHVREIAALSAGKRAGELDLALLLGIEGFRRQDLPQTRQALFETWRTNPGAHFLHGHLGSVTSVAWSEDGQLASGSEDDTVILWDLEHGMPGKTLRGHSEVVRSVAWSASGQLASASADNTVILWDLEHDLPAKTLKGHPDEVYSVAWSEDGQLASGSRDGTVILWDLERQEPARILEGHSDNVSSLAWSSRGRLASGSWDGTIILWDLERGVPDSRLEGHSDKVNSVAWSTERQLASGSWDDTIIIWDLKRGRPDQILKGHTDWVNSVAWYGEKRLASGSNDDTVILWNVRRGKPDRILEGHFRDVSSVAWSAGGQLASGSEGSNVILWDLDKARLELGKPDQLLAEHQDRVTSVAWYKEGPLASGSADGTVILWDLDKSSLAPVEPPQILEGHSDGVYAVAWSADGQLASGSADGTIILWDLAQASLGRGEPAQILEGHQGRVTSVAWSAGGQLASGSEDGTVILWDLAQSSLERGKLTLILEGHSDRVYSVAWSADGQLASGSRDDTVILWDVAKAGLGQGEPARILKRNPRDFNSVAWSIDGQLASGSDDDTVILWDPARSSFARDKPDQILGGHGQDVNSVAWSDDGRLASGSNDGTVILWELGRGVPDQVLEGHGDRVTSVAWSDDGRLASGSNDGMVRVWQLNPEIWTAEACQRAGRNLTRAEWDLYFPNGDYRKTCDQWPPGE
jgi:WD40 repeat protein